MKKILLLSSVFVSSLFIYNAANAQFQASINIGVQPEWGPSGYNYAENYYLPDAEAYYNVPSRQFVYFDRGNWVYASSLPGRFQNYDLYSGYKVVMNERQPWLHFNNHRSFYANYRFRHDQVAIRDFREYGHGGYGRPGFDNRGRDWGYNRSDNNINHRQDRGRNNYNDRQRGGFENDRRHDDDHGGRGRGRW
ncbi:MAG: hypothetical protein ABJB86_02400 [Bacteroidota bacterium]